MEETTTTPPCPDAAPATPATPATSPAVPPKLTLWELMRKDVSPEQDTDDTDRVLTNPRPSIWDIG